jgi:O-antigen/teichoic acid export membrane protein
VIKRLRDTTSRNIQALRRPGSFAQNFAVTFSGTALVAIIGFLVTPIMSRIYPPASYGNFAVFTLLVTNITAVSTLSYPAATVLTPVKKRFYALIQLCLLLALASFALTLVAVLLLREPLLRWLNAESLGAWLYIVPAIALVFNCSNIMMHWYIRTKSFRKRVGIDVSTSLVGRLVTLGAGVALHGGPGGLLIGDVFSKLTAALTLFFGGIHREMSNVVRHVSWARIKAVAYEYREYPLYVTPTGYLNMMAAQLPVFFLTNSFGITAVGLYTFSTSLLELPINLVGNAVAPVFLQKATETYEREPERLKQLCLELYNKLFYLGLLPFGIITVFGDWIFKVGFGARWEQAGLFTSYLGYYYVFKLASYATGPVYAVFRRQRTVLIGTILLVVCRTASLVLGAYLHELNLAMLLFGVSSLVVTFGIDMHILHLLKLPVWRVALRSIALVLLTLALLTGVRRVLSTDTIQQRWQGFYEQYWPK